MKRIEETKKEIQNKVNEYVHEFESKIHLLQEDLRKMTVEQAVTLLSALKAQKWIGESEAFKSLESKVPFQIDPEIYEHYKNHQLSNVADEVFRKAKTLKENFVKDPIGSVKKTVKKIILKNKKAKKKNAEKKNVKSKKSSKVKKKITKKK